MFYRVVWKNNTIVLKDFVYLTRKLIITEPILQYFNLKYYNSFLKMANLP